jgi:hypothetical protein
VVGRLLLRRNPEPNQIWIEIVGHIPPSTTARKMGRLAPAVCARHELSGRARNNRIPTLKPIVLALGLAVKKRCERVPLTFLRLRSDRIGRIARGAGRADAVDAPPMGEYPKWTERLVLCPAKPPEPVNMQEARGTERERMRVNGRVRRFISGSLGGLERYPASHRE